MWLFTKFCFQRYVNALVRETNICFIVCACKHAHVVCVCVSERMVVAVWRSEDTWPLSPSATGSRSHTQATSLGSKHLYWLNHLTGPKIIIFQVL